MKHKHPPERTLPGVDKYVERGRYTQWPLKQRKLPPPRPPVIHREDEVIHSPAPEVGAEISPSPAPPTTTSGTAQCGCPGCMDSALTSIAEE